MKKAVLGMMLFAGSMLAGPRISIGFGFGAPAVAVARPVCPGPGYVWADGYWNWAGGRYVWVPGVWRRPPYAGAYWAHPHYDHYPTGWAYHEGHWDHEDHGDHHDWGHH